MENQIPLSENNANEALTPAELIKKHNSNPKHIITDDEMKNLKVGDDAETASELQAEIEEKEAEDNCHNHENNPYDILDA
jgi:hypothetical protein